MIAICGVHVAESLLTVLVFIFTVLVVAILCPTKPKNINLKTKTPIFLNLGFPALGAGGTSLPQTVTCAKYFCNDEQ